MSREEPLDLFFERMVEGEPISRRAVLQRMAAAGVVLGGASSFLAACGGVSGTETKTTDTAAVAAVNHPKTAIGTMVFSNWPLYIDRKVIKPWQKANDARLKYIEDINDNDEFFAKVQDDLRRNGDAAHQKREAAQASVQKAAQQLVGRLRVYIDGADTPPDTDFTDAAATDEARRTAVEAIMADLGAQAISGAVMANGIELARFYLLEAARLAGVATVSVAVAKAEALRAQAAQGERCISQWMAATAAKVPKMATSA